MGFASLGFPAEGPLALVREHAADVLLRCVIQSVMKNVALGVSALTGPLSHWSRE